MPKKIVSVSQFTEEQVGSAYVILQASTGGEKAVVRSIGRPGASLEIGWEEKLRTRFREQIQSQMGQAGPVQS